MNKEGFLKELRDHLRVLDEREQEDIIDEYAQHIDLKMKSGLSEEEAISDLVISQSWQPKFWRHITWIRNLKKRQRGS